MINRNTRFIKKSMIGVPTQYSTIVCQICGFSNTTQLGLEDSQEEFNRLHKCIDKFKKQQAFVDVAVKLRAFF